MNAPSDAEVIAGYLGYHQIVLAPDKIFRRVVEKPWAVDYVGALAYENPERCWRLVSTMAIARPGEDVMTFLGVALTSALREHPLLIERIEADVRVDAHAAELLSWVLEDEGIEPDVWHRIERLSPDRGEVR